MAGAFETLNFKIARGNVRKTEWLCFEVEWLSQLAARPRDNRILITGGSAFPKTMAK
jgi:hypothetical protein